VKIVGGALRKDASTRRLSSEKGGSREGKSKRI
jgi:hypothetical protein